MTPADADYFVDPGWGYRSDRFIVKATPRPSLLFLTKHNALPGRGRPGRASEFSGARSMVPAGDGVMVMLRVECRGLRAECFFWNQLRDTPKGRKETAADQTPIPARASGSADHLPPSPTLGLCSDAVGVDAEPAAPQAQQRTVAQQEFPGVNASLLRTCSLLRVMKGEVHHG